MCLQQPQVRLRKQCAVVNLPGAVGGPCSQRGAKAQEL
jgi:hypothetical protein